MSEEFFIGWQGKAPEKTGKFLKRRVVMALVAVLAIGAGSAALQGTIGKGRFDFGNVQEFKGVLVKDPVPTLLGDDGVYYTLVNEWKYGFPMEEAEKWHLKPVVVKGTWIGDGVESMIEVVEGGVSAGEGEAGIEAVEEEVGEVVLRGEIVDSKCYLGVMNPGVLKGHRACAIRCISGGVPPVLLVRRGDGTARYFVLVMEGGGMANETVLPFVAEGVEVKGRLVRNRSREVLYLGEGAISRL